MPFAALRAHVLFLLLLAAHFALPMLVWGSLAAGVHDNLDSEVVYAAVIGRFWASGADPSAFAVFLGGVLHWADFARTLQPMVLLYAALPPVWAYALTEAAHLVLAYAGFRALLAVLGLRSGAALACLAAFGLSYSSHGAGLAGAPLMLALIFRSGAVRGWEIGLALVLGLNSSFALHGLFLPIAALGLALMTRRQVMTLRATGLLAVYLAGSLAASAGLVMAVLSGVASHRADWAAVLPTTPLADWAAGTLTNLLTLGSAYHAVITPALHMPVILVAAVWAGQRRGALGLAGFVALAVAVRLAEPWATLHLGALGSIQWHRFLLFAPLLVLVLAAMAPGRMVRAAVALSLALAILAGLGINPAALKASVPQTLVANIRATLKSGDRAGAVQGALAALSGLRPADLARGVETWDRHFRPGAYACLARALAGEPGARRVISHGPDAMIAPFHGIAAVDGYHNFYPLAYKHAFRPVISARLAADPALAAYFDGWGSRVGTLADRGPDIAPDWAAAAALGASHVIADRPVQGLAQVAACDGLRLYRIAP